MAALGAIRDRLAKAPVAATVADPVSGKPVVVALGLGDFQASLRRPPADWPAFILSVYHGHHEGWALETIAIRRNAEGPTRLIEPLIDSSLGVSGGRGHRLWTDPAAALLGYWDFEAVLGSAAAWPTPEMDDALRLPVVNSTPILFIHGDWDIATPIDNTLSLLPYFPEARALLVHRGTHQTRTPLFKRFPAIREQIIGFLRTGKLGNLPVTVELPPTIFRAPAFPPGN